MKRVYGGAFFFLFGCAAFAAIPWTQSAQTRGLILSEPYFLSPVQAFSNLVMLRNDASGKGFFGASRGSGKNKRAHQGVDLLTGVGSPIFASKSGRVSEAGIGRGYGWYVELVHPDGRVSRYAHLTRVFVSRGEWVRAGQRLGTAGKSGNADDPRMRPHLHFEIRENGTALDPFSGLMEPSLKVR